MQHRFGENRSRSRRHFRGRRQRHKRTRSRWTWYGHMTDMSHFDVEFMSFLRLQSWVNFAEVQLNWLSYKTFKTVINNQHTPMIPGGRTFLRVLLNLIMHDYPPLVSGALKLLFDHFGQRQEVLSNFKQVRCACTLMSETLFFITLHYQPATSWKGSASYIHIHE